MFHVPGFIDGQVCIYSLSHTLGVSCQSFHILLGNLKQSWTFNHIFKTLLAVYFYISTKAVYTNNLAIFLSSCLTFRFLFKGATLRIDGGSSYRHQFGCLHCRDAVKLKNSGAFVFYRADLLECLRFPQIRTKPKFIASNFGRVSVRNNRSSLTILGPLYAVEG